MDPTLSDLMEDNVPGNQMRRRMLEGLSGKLHRQDRECPNAWNALKFGLAVAWGFLGALGCASAKGQSDHENVIHLLLLREIIQEYSCTII